MRNGIEEIKLLYKEETQLNAEILENWETMWHKLPRNEMKLETLGEVLELLGETDYITEINTILL